MIEELDLNAVPLTLGGGRQRSLCLGQRPSRGDMLPEDGHRQGQHHDPQQNTKRDKPLPHGFSLKTNGSRAVAQNLWLWVARSG